MKSALRLLPLFAVVAVLLTACQGGSSPTEPSAPAAASMSATASATSAASTAADESGAVESPAGRRLAARVAAEGAAGEGNAPVAEEQNARTTADGNGHGNGGNGGGNGNGGNGGGNGGNGHHGGGAGTLHLEMQPDTWNTNYANNASGTVAALVRGDVSKVDTASVKLVGDGGTATPTRVQTSGGQLRAFFTKADAIAVLDHPARGDSREVKLQLTVDGTAAELTTRVRIVGPAGGDDPPGSGEVTATVQPSTWNTNWSHANGTVSVVLRGDVADIDLTSIKLVGDAGTEVLPTSVKRTGHEVRARFAMDDAFASLDDPDPGETHDVKVTFSNGGTAKELTLTVRIVGPGTK